MTKVKIIRYKTLGECFRAIHGIAPQSKVMHFWNEDGKKKKITRRLWLKRARQWGFWGWSSRSDSEIHIWINRRKAKDRDCVDLLTHELGHLQKPHFRTRKDEEIKAGKYATVAIQAYDILKNIKRKKI
jgi:hypothetical protein